MARNYRVAVFGRTGHGNYGHGLDTCWARIPNVEVVAVADDDQRGLAAAAKRLKVDAGYADYRKLLAEVPVDLVAVAPRWVDQHRAMAIAAAEHGAHVYMEKPFCRTLTEADEVVAACNKHSVKLALAHPTHYSPKLETIRRLIAEGAIGQVLEYRARGKEDSRGGGLDLWVLGTHVLDMIRALGGKPTWCQALVTQAGQPVTRKDVTEGAEGIGPLAGDEVQAMFGMPDQSTAYFSSRRNAKHQLSRYGLQIHGSGGVIELLEGTLPDVRILSDSSWSPPRSGRRWQNVSSAGIDQPEPLKHARYQSRHDLAITDLLQAIEENRP
ncbi:MAG: Gfo/Idh/MocA family oxidoreductase, partial [Planctomycetaceae bacterium]